MELTLIMQYKISKITLNVYTNTYGTNVLSLSCFTDMRFMTVLMNEVRIDPAINLYTWRLLNVPAIYKTD